MNQRCDMCEAGEALRVMKELQKPNSVLDILEGSLLFGFVGYAFFFNFLSYLFNTCVRDSNITSVEGVVQFFSNYVYHIYFLLSSSQNNSNHNLTHF